MATMLRPELLLLDEHTAAPWSHTAEKVFQIKELAYINSQFLKLFSFSYNGYITVKCVRRGLKSMSFLVDTGTFPVFFYSNRILLAKLAIFLSG